MLVALLLSYVLGGSGTAFIGVLTTATLKDLGNRVAAALEEPVRAERAGSLLRDDKSDVKKFEKAYLASEKTLTKYYRDHSQNGNRMMAEINDLERRWEAGQRKMLALRFELKSELTREEWEKVFTQQ